MKKSARKQSINDFPPLASDSLLESVPLASLAFPLSGQEQPEGEQAVKKTPTKKTRRLTPRYLIQRHREIHWQCVRLANLTVAEFRKHLAKDLSGLILEEPAYQASSSRKKTREALANQFGIDVADVEAIEWSLKKPSRRASKTSPYDATLRIVTRKHPGVAEKTVEKIWQELRPDIRKTPTTQAAERTPS